MNRFLLTALVLAWPGAAAAQAAQGPPTLSLADALALAREHSPAYRQVLNDRGPAAWRVRNAWTALVTPQVTAAGGLSYAGRGEQVFLTSSFAQNVPTVTSFYDFGLSWQLSGATLAAPPLARAQQRATEADVDGARATLDAAVTQQFLTVLQAAERAVLARRELERNEEFLTLARARHDVGRASLIDVRQAQVARGQAEVAQLRAETAVRVETLRLFQQLGVEPMPDVRLDPLGPGYTITPPGRTLDELLELAAQGNPPLRALRARRRAAAWGVRAAASSYGPSVQLSAGWSGFTQRFTDLEPIIRGQQLSFGTQYASCLDDNQIRQSAGLAPLDCSGFIWGSDNERELRDRNSAYPFDFIRQPFQARLTISVPLFTGFSRRLQVAEARAQEDDLSEAVRARGLEVQTEVSQAFLSLETAFRTVAIQDTNRDAAREQLQLATDRYRLGAGTFFELLDAQVAGLRAEVEYVGAIYDYHRAVAALEGAVGRPLR